MKDLKDLKKPNQEPKSIKKSDQEPKSRKRADHQGKGYVDVPILSFQMCTNNSSKELINNIKQLINNLYDNK